jgi:hypothetical protein
VSRAESPPRAVIDADIIYSRVLHDLMGRVAGRLELLELVWSRELLTEAEQALMERKTISRKISPAARRTSRRAGARRSRDDRWDGA